jgi:hypothetical protein
VYTRQLGGFYDSQVFNRSASEDGEFSNRGLPVSSWSPGSYCIHEIPVYIAGQIRVKVKRNRRIRWIMGRTRRVW